MKITTFSRGSASEDDWNMDAILEGLNGGFNIDILNGALLHDWRLFLDGLLAICILDDHRFEFNSIYVEIVKANFDEIGVGSCRPTRVTNHVLNAVSTQ